jgi:hypothetical protein
MTQSHEAKEALAQGWKKALSDIDLFLELAEPECPVWHSTDNVFVPVEKAVKDVYERSNGAIPDFTYVGHTITEKGFFLQADVVLEYGEAPLSLHLVQIVEIGDNGKAVRVQEYIGPEMDVQP